MDKLNRLDFRIKNEYISKPYQYIDRVKQELLKENSDIQKVIRANNDKYITRISMTEHKVNKVLTDTESIIHQYQKNVKKLTGDLESTKAFRGQITVQQKKCMSLVENLMNECSTHHRELNSRVDYLYLRFKEDTVDLGS